MDWKKHLDPPSYKGAVLMISVQKRNVLGPEDIPQSAYLKYTY